MCIISSKSRSDSLGYFYGRNENLRRCILFIRVSVENQRIPSSVNKGEKKVGEEIEPDDQQRQNKVYPSISAKKKRKGNFFFIIHTQMRDTKDISGARRLCVTFARKREREKKKKNYILPGPK